MIDWKSYLPGLGNDDEEDPVSKTLRTLQQGASDVGAGISTAASSAGTAISSGLGSAASYLPDLAAPGGGSPVGGGPRRLEPGEPSMLEQLPEIGSAYARGATEAIGDRGALLAGMRPPDTVMEAVEASAPAPFRAVKAASDIGSAAGAAALGEYGERASGTDPTFVTNEIQTPLGTIPSVEGPTPRQVGSAIGSVVGDPTSWILPGTRADRAADVAIQGLARGAGRGLGAAGRAVGSVVGDAAEGLGSALGRNAENVAAADARMAAEGSTLAPAGLGALPEPGGAGRQTVEVLQDRLETATAAWQRARDAGDERMAALAREHAVQLESDLADALNARLDLEPAITSDVGRRVESLPLAEETADTLSGAGSRRADVEGLGGPVSHVPSSINLNAGFGALPSEAPRRTSATRSAAPRFEDAYDASGARSLVAAYEEATPERLSEAERRVLEYAVGQVAGPNASPAARARAETLLRGALDAGEGLLARSKVVATGIDGRAMDALIEGQGFTNKFTGVTNIEDAVDATWERVGKTRITREQAREFTLRELGADDMILGKGNLNNRMYAHVTAGPPQLAEAKPAAWFIWEDDTGRVTNLHHHYAQRSPGARIHKGMAEGLEQMLTPEGAIPGTQIIDAPGGPLRVGARKTALPTGEPGRSFADTPFAVGPSGENRMRVLAMLASMPESGRDSLVRQIRDGRITDPDALAGVLLRESSAQQQPAVIAAKEMLGIPKGDAGGAAGEAVAEQFRLGQAVNRNRSETLVVDPNPRNVKAIYLTGPGDAYLNEVMERSGGMAGGTKTRLQQAQEAQRALDETYGKRVPIIFKDTSVIPDEAGGARLASGSKLITDAEEILPDGMRRPVRAEDALAPGRRDIQERYMGAGYADIGVSAGALPATRGAGALSAVNRALGEGLAGGVGGAVIEQGRNPDEDPRTAAARGFAVGAVGFPAATRLARGAARLAGAGEAGAGTRLASALGNVPDEAAVARRRARIAARRPLPELPEGAVPIRATPEAEVGRLRLDLFPPDVRADIQAAAEGTDFARTQRRGVLSDAAVSRMADDDARSVDQLIKGGKMGRAYNPEETVAIRNAVASQADIVRGLSEQIAEAAAGGATPDLLIARRAAESTKLQGLVQVAEGARAEAGRTLRQYAQQAKLIELDPNAAIARIRAKIADPDEFAAIVDEYTKAVGDGADPIVMAKLWAKVERGEIKAGDVFALYRRFNMLSGPRTLEVNVLSGGLNLGYELLGQAAGQAARGRLGEAAAELGAPFKAGARAFQNMAETMWHGVSAEQAARGDLPRTLSSRTDNPAAKAALTTMEIPDRLNAGVDQFYRTLTEEWAATTLAHKQARAAGVSPRSPDWAETVAKNIEAIREDVSKYPEVKALADRVTFSEEPGGLVKGLEDLKRRSPNIVGFVAPFIRTPANIASRAVDISPLGPVRTAVEAATGRGRGRTNLSGRVRDNVIGTAATAWAYTQAQQGNLTGAGPDDPEKVAELRATGWQPYSIKIGDQYWSYANFAPFSLALSAGAAASEAQQYAKPGKGDVASMLADGAVRTGKVVTDMTVLAGLGAVIKAQQDPARYGTQWLSTALSQLMPAGSFVNTIGQATDPLVRRSERTDVATQVSQNLMARVPGLRETVPAAQDPLGRDIPSEQTGLRALNPFRPTTERDEPVLREFLAANVDIGKPREDLTISRYGADGRVVESIPMPLTAAEQRRWNTLRGEALVNLAGRVGSDPGWQSVPAVDRERYLRQQLDTANDYATRTVRGEIGDDEITRRISSRRRAS